MIKNAKIIKTDLGFEDHGILTYMLHLDYGGEGQGFGGYVLGEDYTTVTLKGILQTVGVSHWEDLLHKHLRVEIDETKNLISKIGNILEDTWFDPKAYATEKAKVLEKKV